MFFLNGLGATKLISATDQMKEVGDPAGLPDVTHLNWQSLLFAVGFLGGGTFAPEVSNVNDAVKAAQQVLKDIRSIFAEHAQKAKEAKAAMPKKAPKQKAKAKAKADKADGA